MSAIVFTNVQILDGSGEAPTPGDVRVEGNRIKAIGRDGTAVDRSDAEVIELIATDRCELLNVPIKDMKVPRDILFGMVSRGQDIFIPTGYSQFQEEDRIVCIATSNSRKYLEKVFA